MTYGILDYVIVSVAIAFMFVGWLLRMRGELAVLLCAKELNHPLWISAGSVEPRAITWLIRHDVRRDLVPELKEIPEVESDNRIQLLLMMGRWLFTGGVVLAVIFVTSRPFDLFG